jgi:hypothetical protein
MGAGQGQLRLRDVSVTRLDLEIGAGQVEVDLTGDRKKDLDADIEGGVGHVCRKMSALSPTLPAASVRSVLAG